MLKQIKALGTPGIFMALALPALLIVQGVWLYMTFKIERDRFDSAAQEALYRTAEILRMREASQLLVREPELNAAFGGNMAYQVDISQNDSLTSREVFNVSGTQDIRHFQVSDSQQLRELQELRREHPEEAFSIQFTIGDSLPVNVQQDLLRRLGGLEPHEIAVDSANQRTVCQPSPKNVTLQGKTPKHKLAAIRRLMAQMLTAEVPLERRLDSAMVSNVLATQIKEKGLKDIDAGYEFAIEGYRNQKLVRTAGFTTHTEAFYQVGLFPDATGEDMATLYLSFPDKDLGYNWRHVIIMQVITSLIAIVIWAYIATLKNLRHQRELSLRKTVFINNLSHELKTPITSIGLATDVLKSQLPENSPYIKILREETDRMYRQIQRVLQTAELDKTDLLSELEPVDMQAFLKARLDSFSPQADAQGTTLHYTAEGLPTLETDQLLLTTAIDNLIDNALKYGGEGGTVTLSAAVAGERLHIRIADTGPGIAAAELKQIFEPYYRPKTDRHDVQGFGLGLSQVREIVRLLGGEVSVKSTIGSGSTFEIYLPTHLPQSN